MTAYRKKLIEVALPLEAINIASAREKSIRHGHPSTLHLWWARRPLAAARAVIFSQMVDDPSEYVDELLADEKTRKAAERAYKARRRAWEERKAVYEKAQAAGMSGPSNPEPGLEPTLEETAAAIERQRLFRIIEELVKWESTTDEQVLQPARDEIWKSWRRTCAQNQDHPRASELFNPDKLPGFHDPFAGGGALPLEAQRLGLESYASDLNPVAVLINKAMIEFPPKFVGMPPVNPEAKKAEDFWSREWKGAEGLAEDVRYYGQWMREEAEKRIGQHYPKVKVTKEMANERPDLKQYEGQELTVIAWIWTRTVKSPNPAFAKIDVPLASTFMLSTKPGKEAFIEPIMKDGDFVFEVKLGKPKDDEIATNGTSAGKKKGFFCLISRALITYDYIRKEGRAGHMGERLMAIVAEGDRGRLYLSPQKEFEQLAKQAKPSWRPEVRLEGKCRVNVSLYGFDVYGDLFTPRQLIALETFTDLVVEAKDKVYTDSLKSEPQRMTTGDSNLRYERYANAVALYLAFSIDKAADYWSTICTWHSSKELIRNTFGRQAIPMTWDFVEANVFSESSGNVSSGIEWARKVIKGLPLSPSGTAIQNDACDQRLSLNRIVSTDPPYFDNIGYADLSDFFYVWLRRSLKSEFPDLFSTVAVPKSEELVATPSRHGSKAKAEAFFLEGMTKAMRQIAEQSRQSFPVTIYYAYKQAESVEDGGTANTGWDTFLGAVIEAGFAITGTWPMRTELSNRMIGSGTNALASSIVLVCRKCGANAPVTTRREFISMLHNELPLALAHLQTSNIAPVDLAQAAIGPGMAVFTRYSKVLDAQGQPLSVRQALGLINEILDEVLAEQEGDFDSDTRWALAWFEQNGFSEGEYGTAEILSKAKDTSVTGMVAAGILSSGRGKVRLLKPKELAEDWDPNKDARLTVWEMVHQLIRALEEDGESGAAQLMAKLGAKAETARELCYRLYTLCERKKRASEALSYNALVQSWPEILRLAQENRPQSETQAPLF
jgi:putative DNA methylase